MFKTGQYPDPNNSSQKRKAIGSQLVHRKSMMVSTRSGSEGSSIISSTCECLCIFKAQGFSCEIYFAPTMCALQISVKDYNGKSRWVAYLGDAIDVPLELQH